MQHVLDWLRRPIGIGQCATVCALLTLANGASDQVVSAALSIFHVQIAPEESRGIIVDQMNARSPLSFILWIVPVLLGAALVESWLFQAGPYTVVDILTRVTPIGHKIRVAALVIVVIGCSVWFGWAHGNPGLILFQGVAGIFYFLMFIKTGGGYRRYWRAYLCIVTTHFLYDVIVIFGYYAQRRA